MTESLNAGALDQLFRNARTINVWQNKPVEEAQIRALYDLLKMAPTSANCCPARFYFVKSDTGKARLKPHLMEGNDEKMMAAPVTVIIATDKNFAEKLPHLFPHSPDAASWFSDPVVSEETAFRNSTLQGAYLMMAARSIGLDCGPMSGFDAEGVDKEFFAGTSLKSNFLCSLGYGSNEGIFPRSPRLTFDECAKIV
ncbi:MAG: malonic semialdehyde reductase [Kordiimonadaceae bacterium]|nr:malonic semialdehyde reductase [Kordiimonadaceae bacterium]